MVGVTADKLENCSAALRVDHLAAWTAVQKVHLMVASMAVYLVGSLGCKTVGYSVDEKAV